MWKNYAKIMFHSALDVLESTGRNRRSLGVAMENSESLGVDEEVRVLYHKASWQNYDPNTVLSGLGI